MKKLRNIIILIFCFGYVQLSALSNPIAISATVTPFSITSAGHVVFGFAYSGITPANNNDLRIDVYKSNSAGALVSLIGQQTISSASINGIAFIDMITPTGIALIQSDKIAVKLTGITPPGTQFPPIGTSSTFYNLPPCCDIPPNYLGLQFNGLPQNVYIDQNGQAYFNNCLGENFGIAFHCPGGSIAPHSTWDFGDGTVIVSSTTGAVHTYAAAGTYQVTGIYAIDQTCAMQIGPVNVYVNQANCSPQVCEGRPNINLPGAKEKTCAGSAISFVADACIFQNTTLTWSFGDGLTGTGSNVSHVYQYPGTYSIILTVNRPGYAPQTATITIVVEDCIETDCKDCLGSFQPTPGNYIMSVWVKEVISPLPQSYSNPKVEINFTGTSASPLIIGTDGSKNKIIDGWQRIEEQFTIPTTASHLLLKLKNTGSNDVYFDDIRIFPVDGQMKTYVYDPITLRLTATLDENNYATFYEYDEEGKLIRVKKETEKGIMTIQESREGNKKK